jgi:apolipoprotein N-acyltransferase
VKKARAEQGNAASDAAPLLVVWPESAVPFLLADSPVGLKMIGDALPENAWLFTGALRRAPEEMRRPGGPRLFNSILGIDTNGDIRFIYDKRRLVPFGEYLPLEGLFRPLGLRQVVPVPKGFFFGRDPGPHRVDGLPPFEAFVCYEIVFDDPPARARETRWLLNVTTDAWFGTSAGPHQHFMAARFRAIERGVPLVRAANTGISAVVDGRGRIVRGLPQFRRGVITARLPANYSQPFYARVDRWQIVLAMLILLVLMGLRRTRHGSPKRV